MKMIKALVCALSLLSMTASVSAGPISGPILGAIAGCIVAQPMAHQVKAVGKSLRLTKLIVKGMYDNLKRLPENQVEADVLAFQQQSLKHELYTRAIPNVLKEVTKLAVTEALAAGAIFVAVVS